MQTHAPVASQVWPSPQAAQLPPALPHAAAVGVAHWPVASQHPFGQEVALQAHLPPLHT